MTLYLPVLELLEPRLSPGALVIADNAVEQSGEFLTYVRNPDNGYLTIPLPFGEHRGNENVRSHSVIRRPTCQRSSTLSR